MFVYFFLTQCEICRHVAIAAPAPASGHGERLVVRPGGGITMGYAADRRVRDHICESVLYYLLLVNLHLGNLVHP